MNEQKLKNLAKRNEVSLQNSRYGRRNFEHYYGSLRHALGFYFNTFHTNNSSYDSYAEGLAKRNVRFIKYQLLDEDNTVLSIITFERFFELFLKDLLRKTDRRMTYRHRLPRSGNQAQLLIQKIRNDSFKPLRTPNGFQLVPFRECIDRFYDLVELHKSKYNDPIVRKFRKILLQYPFLDSEECKASLKLLNSQRDEILHKGNKLANLWFLDYMISQRLIPLVKQITDIEGEKLGDSTFYFTTQTGVNVLKALSDIKFEFKELENPKLKNRMFHYLLYMGHLKEMGRANMNMNLFAREGRSAYEYNYRDFFGRGKRFAEAERRHPDFECILDCPCCGEKSMVRYKITMRDIFEKGVKHFEITWVKCYTCDYHIRYNAGDPATYNLSPESIFN